jgi:hypothetical protein
MFNIELRPDVEALSAHLVDDQVTKFVIPDTPDP